VRTLQVAAFWLIGMLSLLPQAAFSGGSGLNVVVVVNQYSTNSVRLGNEYCQQRGVPPQNLIRMTNWTGGRVSWTHSEFESCLKHFLMDSLATRALTNQVQVVLLSMDIPYRVTEGQSANSTTSVLFYGFKTNTVPPAQNLPVTCSLPDESSNSYAFSEMPFPEGAPNTAVTNSLLCFLLTDTSFEGALNVLSNGVYADQRFPTNSVYLASPTDVPRNVREPLFDNAAFEEAVTGGRSLQQTNTDSTAFTQIGGLETGLYTFRIPNSAFIPGAISDTLTSYAGGIFENLGQSVLLEFLHGGAAASYGTVVEPCNYTEKFPDPMVYFFQGRGFSAAEAYYQSVRNPYQGLYVGEPLSAPFARTGAGDWPGLPDASLLRGITNLTVECEAAGADRPVGRVDLYVDGLFQQTLTNVLPSGGNFLRATLKNVTISYQVASGDTIQSAARGLAAAINRESNRTDVQASTFGDRLLLTGLTSTKTGASLSLSATASAGTAPGQTTWLRSVRATFLDSPAQGYATVTISNTNKLAIGDWLQIQVQKTNGSTITLGVTNTSAQGTVTSISQALTNAVLSSSELQVIDGVTVDSFLNTTDNTATQFAVKARTPGWPAAGIQISLSGSAGFDLSPAQLQNLEENVSDLRPRNHLYVASGIPLLSFSVPLDTTRLADGYHELTALAMEGTSVRTQTRIPRQVRVQNTGLSGTISTTGSGYAAISDTNWTIAVGANRQDVSRIDLYSTGGRIGFVTNRSTFEFPVPTTALGEGLHPFYATITDSQGNSYRTETLMVRLIPPIALVLNSEATLLSWNAAPGVPYEVLRTPDMNQPFQVIQRVTATSSTVQISLPPGFSSSAFYQVRAAGN
jgi:uncharacterized protein (TIGR03790 family)